MNSIENVLDLLQEINNTYSSFIQESNFVRVDNNISWPNYRKGLNKSFYVRQYQELLSQRQYSFLLIDKSFIQIYFEFDVASNIKTIKYSYYPYPIILNEKVDTIESYFDNYTDEAISQFYYDLLNVMSEEVGITLNDKEREETILFFKETYGYQLAESDLRQIAFDKIYELTNYSHFRMDYDATVSTHHKCEFQFGAIKQIRLPIAKILTPFIFFDYVLRYFFKKNYSSLVSERVYKRNFLRQKRNCIPIANFKEHSFYKVI